MNAYGAGEILLTSMDRDGTKRGFDLELTQAISEAVSIPVIASGGVGTLDHLADGVLFGKADAPFPLSNPGTVSIPIGFIAAWLGTILTARDPDAEAKFAELKVRAHTGLGSEKAVAH